MVFAKWWFFSNFTPPSALISWHSAYTVRKHSFLPCLLIDLFIIYLTSAWTHGFLLSVNYEPLVSLVLVILKVPRILTFEDQINESKVWFLCLLLLLLFWAHPYFLSSPNVPVYLNLPYLWSFSLSMHNLEFSNRFKGILYRFGVLFSWVFFLSRYMYVLFSFMIYTRSSILYILMWP